MRNIIYEFVDQSFVDMEANKGNRKKQQLDPALRLSFRAKSLIWEVEGFPTTMLGRKPWIQGNSSSTYAL